MKYFEVGYDGERYSNRWHFKEPIDQHGRSIESNLLSKVGPFIGTPPIYLPIDEEFPGGQLDFNFSHYNMVVMTTAVADMVVEAGGHIQRFPVTLLPANQQGFEIVFTLVAVKDIVDLSRAREYQRYERDDERVSMRYGGVAPRQKGMLSNVAPLCINAQKAKGHEFFRPWEYTSALIVSENLKDALQCRGVTGIKFTLVS